MTGQVISQIRMSIGAGWQVRLYNYPGMHPEWRQQKPPFPMQINKWCHRLYPGNLPACPNKLPSRRNTLQPRNHPRGRSI